MFLLGRDKDLVYGFYICSVFIFFKIHALANKMHSAKYANQNLCDLCSPIDVRKTNLIFLRDETLKEELLENGKMHLCFLRIVEKQPISAHFRFLEIKDDFELFIENRKTSRLAI